MGWKACHAAIQAAAATIAITSADSNATSVFVERTRPASGSEFESLECWKLFGRQQMKPDEQVVRRLPA